jgi:hypothetical protein
VELFLKILLSSWHILLDSGPYIVLGIVTAGLVKVFLKPETVAKHLGEGRFLPVIKAALLGIPLPLCSCGVLPAAASLKKQGANTGATASFLISTPESGVDSIALTYALMDPVMTVARPVSAFATAVAAGLGENLSEKNLDTKNSQSSAEAITCCQDCSESTHHHAGQGHEEKPAPASWAGRVLLGFRYGFFELWSELAVWFMVGIILSGVITALAPAELLQNHLGGGLTSMLIMLMVGVPLYICATASTPIAAALIIQGVSPGTALVFLLAGPATNLASLSVLLGVLGKKATAIYLACIALFAIASGLVLDQIYASLAMDPVATMGQAAELAPLWLKWVSALGLIALSIKPVYQSLKKRLATQIRGREKCFHQGGADNHALKNSHAGAGLSGRAKAEHASSLRCSCQEGPKDSIE